MSVTTSDEIETRRPASTFEAIERTPNIVQSGANAVIERPRLRGLSSNRVLIGVDGERLNKIRSDTGATGILPSVVDVSRVFGIGEMQPAGVFFAASEDGGRTFSKPMAMHPEAI